MKVMAVHTLTLRLSGDCFLAPEIYYAYSLHKVAHHALDGCARIWVVCTLSAWQVSSSTVMV